MLHENSSLPLPHGRGTSKQLDGEDDLAEGAGLDKVAQGIGRLVTGDLCSYPVIHPIAGSA